MLSAPSFVRQKYQDKKTCLRPDGGVADPRDTTRYRCGLCLALGANPSFSFFPDIPDSRHYCGASFYLEHKNAPFGPWPRCKSSRYLGIAAVCALPRPKTHLFYLFHQERNTTLALVFAEPTFQIVNAGATFHELGIHHQFTVQRNVGLNAFDHGFR